MSKRVILPAGAAESKVPFSRAILIRDHLYICGMTAHVMSTADPKDRSLPTTVEDQTRRTLENIKACVEAANGTMADIYKVVVMLKDPRDYRKMNTVRAEYFVKEPPVSTCFRADLMSPDILVEIEAAAYVPQADG